MGGKKQHRGRARGRKGRAAKRREALESARRLDDDAVHQESGQVDISRSRDYVLVLDPTTGTGLRREYIR